jgi:hypothetical protein
MCIKFELKGNSGYVFNSSKNLFQDDRTKNISKRNVDSYLKTLGGQFLHKVDNLEDVFKVIQINIFLFNFF